MKKGKLTAALSVCHNCRLCRGLLLLTSVLAACAEAPQLASTPPEELPMQNLRRQLQDGDFTVVVNRFAAADSPGPAEYEFRYLARAQLALGRYDQARETVRLTQRYHPKDPELYDMLGAIHTAEAFSRSEFAGTEKALAAFTHALELDSSRAHSLFNIGLLHGYREQAALADSFYRRALSVDSTLAVAHKKLGLLRREQGELAAARQYLTQALRYAPDDVEALLYLGLTERSLGRMEDAAVHLERAAELNPLSPQVHSNLAGVYMRLGRRDEGRQAIRRSELLRKFDRGIGSEKTVLSHQTAVSVAPTTARYNRALHLALTGDRVGAEREFLHLIEVLPDHADALSALGLLHFWRGDAVGAIDYLTRAVKVDPEDAINLARLGMVLRRSSESSAALDTLRRAAQLDTTLAEPVFELAMIYAQTRRYALAESLFAKTIELSPENPEAHLNLGVARLRQGDTDGAVAAYRRAVELDPEGERAQAYLREALQQQRSSAAPAKGSP
ncbi:MAG: tetratricopeptide repeat protein [Candidatus Latescibacterota bacterium]|nr:tetratricopeptide repeat protein [Candidatus Latescibacterota bacterium]